MVDTGDLLYKTPWPLETEAEQLRLKAHAVGEISGRLGVVASAVGECDLAGGLEEALAIAKKAGFQFLCANVIDAAGRKPFAPHTIVDVGGVAVGLFGLTTALVGNAPGAQGLTQQDAFAAAREQVRILRSRCRLVVCLSHMGLSADQELARQTLGIDIILGGHSREMTTDPLIVGGTVIAQAFSQGKYVGRLDLNLPATPATTGTWIMTTYGPPKPGFTGAPQFAASFPPLDKNLADEAATKARVQQYNAEVAKLGAAKAVVPPIAGPMTGTSGAPPQTPSTPPPSSAASGSPGSFVYWGTSLCASCHVEQTRFWERTRHARAIDILKTKNRVNDQECIGCHSTGFRKPGGFELPARVGGFENVQCEACHGPGVDHGKGGMAKLSTTESTCKSCHDKENSPAFDFETMLPMMSCPKMKKVN